MKKLTVICKNCNNQLEGNFCSNCGQNSNVGKIDFKYVINDIPDSIFQVNSGLFFTVKELFLRPGKSIREFIIGKRKRFFKPIAYVLLISTLYALLSMLVEQGTVLGEVVRGMSQAFKTDDKYTSVTKLFDWIINNHAYSTIILLPFLSLASYLAFFKCKFNYFEHFILNAYITAQQALIYSFFVIIQFTVKSESYFLQYVPLSLAFTFGLWAFLQFFNNEKKLKVVLLYLLTYFIYFILISLLILSLIIISSI
ncbi:MAG: DUF3667 domain-containing protein [Ferruginibacter sp.]